MRSHLNRRLGLVGLAGIVLVAFGFMAGLALAVPPAVPPSLAKDRNESSKFVLVRHELKDSQDVQLNVKTGSQALLSVPGSGMVTALNCSMGQQLNAWESNISIDGGPVLNLSTLTPLWRDLRIGDAGADVEAIQTELRRLGYSVTADGVLGESTIRIVNERLEELGATATDPTLLSRSRIMWLPAPSVIAASCAAALGAPIAAGQPVADLQPPVTAVAVVNMPMDLLPGNRVVAIDDVRFVVDEAGQISSGDDLVRFASLPVYLASNGPAAGVGASSTNGVSGSPTALPGGMSAQLELAEAIEAWAVPPGSLYSIRGNRACVSENGRGVKVTVAGSELGKSYVTFELPRQAPASVDVEPAQKLTC